MLHIFNEKTASQSARAMQKYFAKLGLEISYNQALDALGVMSSFENWAGLKDYLSEEAVNARLRPICLEHIALNSDTDYGDEWAIIAHNGFQLRYPQDDVCTYVRICDPLGREIGYWVDDEWQEDPSVVMGAILGALTHGQAIDTSVRKVSLPKAEVHKAMPSTRDLPFDMLSSVEIDGCWYKVEAVASDVIAKLAEPEGDPDEETDSYHVAVYLDYQHHSIHLGRLRHMTWSDKDRCFVGEDGRKYSFNIAQSFADYIKR